MTMCQGISLGCWLRFPFKTRRKKLRSRDGIRLISIFFRGQELEISAKFGSKISRKAMIDLIDMIDNIYL